MEGVELAAFSDRPDTTKQAAGSKGVNAVGNYEHPIAKHEIAESPNDGAGPVSLGFRHQQERSP